MMKWVYKIAAPPFDYIRRLLTESTEASALRGSTAEPISRGESISIQSAEIMDLTPLSRHPTSFAILPSLVPGEYLSAGMLRIREKP